MKRVHIGVGLIAATVIISVSSLSPRAAGASAAAGDPVKGQAVYTAEKCNLCHKIGDTGGKIGPDLTSVGTKRDAVWLAKYLQNPTPIDPKNPPKTKMTAAKAKGPALDDLVAYLLTLKGKK